MFIFYWLLNENTSGPFQNNVFGIEIQRGKLVQIWLKSIFKKNVIFFLDKFEESIGSEFFPKTSLPCAIVVYFFVHQYNFTKMKKKMHHMVWSCFHIDLKKIREIRKNNNFENHKYKRTDDLSGQDR